MARGAIKSASNNSPSNSSSESNDDVIKIQKLLKSQWEERLKLFQQQNNQSKQSFSGQTSSKNILRKARLQLNRKTLLKIRKPESFHHLFSQNNENTKNEHKQSQLKSNSIDSFIDSFIDLLQNASLCPAVSQVTSRVQSATQQSIIRMCNADMDSSAVNRVQSFSRDF